MHKHGDFSPAGCAACHGFLTLKDSDEANLGYITDDVCDNCVRMCIYKPKSCRSDFQAPA